MKTLTFLIALAAICQETWGHGRQLIPKPWTSNGPKYSPFKGKEWQYPGSNNVFCQKEGEPIQCSPSSFVGWPTDFYTNWTMVGEVTNNGSHMRMQVSGQHSWVPGLKKDKSGGNPWAAPGKAIVFGDGCGLGGGNKWGCNVQCKGKGDTDCSGCGATDTSGKDICSKKPVYDTNKAGTCCTKMQGGANFGCGGYVGGMSGLDWYKTGVFQNKQGKVEQTWWKAGSSQVVITGKAKGGGHWGGYAFRLCKVKDFSTGMTNDVSEECFQKTHLEFQQKEQWILGGEGLDALSADEVRKLKNWKKVPGEILKKGTYPKGSQWKLTPDKAKVGDYFLVKDRVKVPKNLAPGSYVLSYRWDCQRSPQVWSACSNIIIG